MCVGGGCAKVDNHATIKYVFPDGFSGYFAVFGSGRGLGDLKSEDVTVIRIGRDGRGYVRDAGIFNNWFKTIAVSDTGKRLHVENQGPHGVDSVSVRHIGSRNEAAMIGYVGIQEGVNQYYEKHESSKTNSELLLIEIEHKGGA